MERKACCVCGAEYLAKTQRRKYCSMKCKRSNLKKHDKTVEEFNEYMRGEVYANE